MKRKSKWLKVLSFVFGLVLLLTVTACGGQSGDKGGQSGEKGELKVGFIANVFGTQSYNDDVLDGLKKSKESLGVDYLALEVPEVTDTALSIQNLIDQGCNFIIVPSAEYRDGMMEAVESHPDVKFLYLPESIEGYDNIMSVIYFENEGAFLLGALGASMTKSNNIGAVLAINGDDVQEKYHWGYKAGAKAINPDCEVQAAYTNSYADINKGFEVAKAMYSKGADFVGSYAGACNLGVFQAAEQAGEGKYAFGAANGQFDKSPDKIVCSLVKPIEVAIHDILKDLKEKGDFDTSKPIYLGISNGGVELKFNDINPDILKVLPKDYKQMIDDLTKGISDGSIKVPADEAAYNAFDYSYKK